ncbi:RimK family alpha-L-glutamate ligase [Nanoarchaeota archaeon]
MNLCIIGPEKRSKSDIELVEKGNKYFDSVLYVPIQNIRVEAINEKPTPFFKGTDLTKFDVVLPRFDTDYAGFSYVLMKIFEEYGVLSPISSVSTTYAYNEFLTPLFLKEEGIPTPNIYFSISRQSLENKISSLKYPVLLRLPYHKKGEMVLKSENSLKGVIDTMQRLAQPIMIEENYKNPIPMKILVIGPDTYAVKGDGETYSLSSGEHQIILRSTRLLNTLICQVNAVKVSGELQIKNLELYPDIVEFGSLFKKDLIGSVLKYLSEASKYSKGKDVIGRFLDWFRESRWN